MPGRRLAWGVFLAFACLYLLTIGRGFYSSDGEVMFKTTVALAERGSFALAPDAGLPQIVRGRGGAYFSKYDPGLPLLGVPFYVMGDQIAAINGAHRYRLAATACLALPALAAAVALAGLALIARQVGMWWLPVLAAGLATPLWPYARTLFPEALLAAALALAVLAVLRSGAPGARQTAWLIAGGVACGIGILTRAAFAIYTLPLAFLVVRQGRPGAESVAWRRLAVFGAGAAPFVAGVLAHNALRFGDPLRSGYGGEGFTTPPWEGAIGLLLSPGRSVFLYAPPLLLSALLWPRFRRAHPAPGRFLALAWGVALPFYGAWWAWGGGWCWGPRFLVPLVALSCLPLAALPAGRAWRAAAGVLIALGIGVQVLGVLTDVTPHFAALAAQDQAGDAEFSLRSAPLWAAAQRAGRGKTESLGLFHLAGTGLPRTWSVGVPLILTVGVAAGAWQMARAVRPHNWRRERS